jgi:hypothetical protein
VRWARSVGPSILPPLFQVWPLGTEVTN